MSVTLVPPAATATIPLGDLLPRIDAAFACVAGREWVPLSAALGRVVAEDVRAAAPVPSFPASAVDGWAVRAGDLGGGGRALPVGGRIAAGHPLGGDVRPGHAYRIFTGAPVPPGLDAVAMQEDCRRDGDLVAIPSLRRGDNLRPAGETLTEGALALRAGVRVRPQEIGVAAMLGLERLPVRARLRVALFSTGDELREVGTSLGAGCIHDANRHLLRGLLQGFGCTVTDFGIVADHALAVRDAIAEAAQGQDLVLTSGGASVGDEDHVKSALAELGRIDQWRVAIRPGKPLILGRVGETPFVGLPGNPVSAMVCFLLIARPILARLGGLDLPPPRRYPLPAGFTLRKTEPRREFRRAVVAERDGRAVVELVPGESSGMLTSMTAAEGLVDLPEGPFAVAPGDPVEFLPLSGLMP